MTNVKIKLYFTVAQLVLLVIAFITINQNRFLINKEVSSIDVLLIIGIFLFWEVVKNIFTNIMDYKKLLRENKDNITKTKK